MAAQDALSSLQGDSGSEYARSRQPIRVRSYFGADQDSTVGRPRMWDNPQWGGPTNMDLGDKQQVTPPPSYGA